MDIDRVIQMLSEALDDKDWEVIKELLEDLIYEENNPIEEYKKDEDLEDENLWGWHRYRLMLFGIKVQQRLSMSRIKRLNKPK